MLCNIATCRLGLLANNKCKSLVNELLSDLFKRIELKEKIMYTIQKVISIQKSFKDSLATKYGKIEIMENYWDKMIT